MNTFLRILILFDEENEFPLIVCAGSRLDELSEECDCSVLT